MKTVSCSMGPFLGHGDDLDRTYHFSSWGRTNRHRLYHSLNYHPQTGWRLYTKGHHTSPKILEISEVRAIFRRWLVTAEFVLSDSRSHVKLFEVVSRRPPKAVQKAIKRTQTIKSLEACLNL